MTIKIYIAKNIGSGVVVLSSGPDLMWICRVEDPWDDVEFDGVFCHEDQRMFVATRVEKICADREKRGRRAVG